jgi:hypothetical protein
MKRELEVALLAASLISLACRPAAATGTVLIQQKDGSSRTYENVLVRIRNAELAMTTAAGDGTLVIGKDACEAIGKLEKCLPYDATLYQNGGTFRIPLEPGGTVWLNPTAVKQPLPHSGAGLAPHGVLLSITSKKGTYVSLTGTIDEIRK